ICMYAESQESLPAVLPERSTALPVKLENIPREILGLKRWVLWRWEFKDSKWRKIPCSAKLGEADEDWNRAKCNDPKTWSSFKAVLGRLRHFDGIGFMLGDGFAGIDLDQCRDPATGHMDDKSRQIIQDINSYAEISPRGSGVKILVRAKKP